MYRVAEALRTDQYGAAQVSMESHLARHERSALAVNQAQISSEIASLQAKVEEVRQVHGPQLSS